jgi:hypothetical protein
MESNAEPVFDDHTAPWIAPLEVEAQAAGYKHMKETSVRFKAMIICMELAKSTSTMSLLLPFPLAMLTCWAQDVVEH